MYANNYGASQNPYDQRQAASPGYNSPEFRQTNHYGEHQAMGGRDDYGQNVELTPFANAGSQFAAINSDEEYLNKCASIRQEAAQIEKVDLPKLRNAQQAALNSVDPGRASALVEQESTAILAAYTVLVGKIKLLKTENAHQHPDSTRSRQLKLTDDKLKTAMTAYRTIDNDFRKKLKEQTARQIRIVRPEMSEQEVQQAVEETNGEVFSQMLMQSDRRGQSQSTMNAVKSRHDEITKIVQQLNELNQLFQDMDTLVMQQEAAVENIEVKGEEVVENMDKGTQQIGVAIKSARNARKWKWWCLGICILIVAIVVIALVITKPWQTVTPKAARRSLPIQSRRVISEFTNPIGERIVKVGEGYNPVAKRFRRFQS